MKKIILIITFLTTATTLFSQTAGRDFRAGVPPKAGVNPPNFVVNRDVYIDTVAKKTYVQRSSGVWSETKNAYPSIVGATGATGANGTNGTNGISPTVGVGSPTTLPAGSNATVTDSDPSPNLMLNFGIPRGADGSGGGGGTGVFAGFISPDQYLAQHSGKTFRDIGKDQNYINTNYPNIGATLDDAVDWAAIQMCINNSNKGGIVLYGNYFINKPLYYDGTQRFAIFGNMATITAIGTSPFWMLSRKNMPTTFSQAEALVGQSTARIQDVSFSGNNKAQRGINMNCMKDLIIDHVWINSCKVGIQTGFALYASVSHCYVQNSDTAYAEIPVAGSNEATSNLLAYFNCASHTATQIGFYINSAYEVRMDGCGVEGNGTCARAIDYYADNKTTNKDFTVRTFHFEQVGGATDAIIKLRLRDQHVLIDDIIAHYSGILIDGFTSTGSGHVVLSRAVWAVGRAGKMFKSSNCLWTFESCDNLILPYAYNVWEGTAPTFCPMRVQSDQTVKNWGCGWNSFNFSSVPPR